MTDTIGKDKLVTLTYTIQNELGETIEQNDLPVSYVQGAGSQLLPILERNLEGKQAGDTVEVMVSPEEGFGEYDPNLTFKDKLDNVPPEYRQVGAQAEFQNENGDSKTFTVTKIANGRLTLDGNHPLAGKNIKFTVRILEVRDATAEEIAQGQFEHDYSKDMLNATPEGSH
ncbi:MAG: peptidylprolyl isomerase [Granulosicoccaceae bacterium]|jgi:FKBP-type peptidyl-prolyl cis-trans isomerase SlyD